MNLVPRSRRGPAGRRAVVAAGVIGLLVSGVFAAESGVAQPPQPAQRRPAAQPARAASAVPGGHAGAVAAGTRLLNQAASAARQISYRGVQVISWLTPGGSGAWLGSGPVVVSMDVAHRTGQPPAGMLGLTPVLVGLLRTHYAVVYAGRGSAAGRPACIVEALRRDGSIAARFWLDAASKLPLRRELFDTHARLVGVADMAGLKLSVPAALRSTRAAGRGTTTARHRASGGKQRAAAMPGAPAGVQGTAAGRQPTGTAAANPRVSTTQRDAAVARAIARMPDALRMDMFSSVPPAAGSQAGHGGQAIPPGSPAPREATSAGSAGSSQGSPAGSAVSSQPGTAGSAVSSPNSSAGSAASSRAGAAGSAVSSQAGSAGSATSPQASGAASSPSSPAGPAVSSQAGAASSPSSPAGPAVPSQAGAAGSAASAQVSTAGSAASSHGSSAGSAVSSQAGAAGPVVSSQAGAAGSAASSHGSSAGSVVSSQAGAAGSAVSSQVGAAGLAAGAAGVATLPQVSPAGSAAAPRAGAAGSAGLPRPWADRLGQEQTAALRAEGWPAPAAMPGGLTLYDASQTTTATGRVVDLAYSDGLSTVSLFVQRGRLPAALPGWRQADLSGHRLFLRNLAEPDLTWSAGGYVLTVVAGAPAATLASVVNSLPSQAEPGFWSRMGRGVRRLLSWVDPFR